MTKIFPITVSIYGSGLQIWIMYPDYGSVLRIRIWIYNQTNLVYDGLQIDLDLPYSNATIFHATFCRTIKFAGIKVNNYFVWTIVGNFIWCSAPCTRILNIGQDVQINSIFRSSCILIIDHGNFSIHCRKGGGGHLIIFFWNSQ